MEYVAFMAYQHIHVEQYIGERSTMRLFVEIPKEDECIGKDTRCCCGHMRYFMLKIIMLVF
jgi:hypothetical protein